MQYNRLFSKMELDTLCRLRAQGVPYAAISERIGRDAKILRTIFWKEKARPRKVTSDSIQEYRDLIVSHFEAGLEIKEIAKTLGRSHKSILNMLNRLGYDREMRQLIRSESGRTA